MTGLSFIVATGGGGGGTSSTTDSTTSSTSTAGYTVPSEISAVPTNQTQSGASLTVKGFSHALKASPKAVSRAYNDAGTDYSNAETKRYVEEHTLMQFEILEQVFNAINQTHYNEVENIGADPYKCMVAWEDEQNGIDIKVLEPWIVESDEIEEEGQTLLRVRAWIEEVVEDTGETSVGKAELKITETPEKLPDGSYSDYGAWTMNVKFDAAGENDYFAASASKTEDGQSLIKIHERFVEGGPMGQVSDLDFTPVMDMKAIMYRGTGSGYGKVHYPKFEDLWDPDVDVSSLTELPHKTAKYAYNATYLAVQAEGGSVVYKDRTTVTEMTHKYGVYNKSTGADIEKSKNFGFPIRYTVSGATNRAFYGAWQGRHQLWGPENDVSQGTTVYREDLPPGQSEKYTAGPTFKGVLTKRTYVDAHIDDIKNIPIEMWLNNDYNLIYEDTDGKWYNCKDWDWQNNQCETTPTDFDATVGLTSLIVGADDNVKNVYISAWDNQNNQHIYYVYEAASSNNSGAGFYLAEEEETDYGRKLKVKIPRQLYAPNDNDQLWVFVGGRIFVEWKGSATGWVEKEVIAFNNMHWKPTFSESGDKAFTLPEGREIYANLEGANYVITRSGNTYTTKLELQTAANPSNASSVVASGTIFKDQWSPDGSSTYELDTDSTSDTYMLLVYKTIGDADKDANGDPKEGVAVGAVVKENFWGLEAYVDGAQTGKIYNWEYSSSGGWGSVTYLLNEDGTYKILDDPMRFDTFTAQDNAGNTKTLALQFDGWMMGLPDLHQELSKNDWTMTTAISDKIINLAAGTEVTESSTGTVYVLKPLDISQFLKVVPDTTSDLPDISVADAVDLADVPNFTEHGMGDMPVVDTVKYSEGVLVQ